MYQIKSLRKKLIKIMVQEISCANIYMDFLDCWSELGEYLFFLFNLSAVEEEEKEEVEINLDDYVCDFV